MSLPPSVHVVSLSWTEIVAKSSSSYSFLIVLDYVYRFTHDVNKSLIVNCSIQYLDNYSAAISCSSSGTSNNGGAILCILETSPSM